MGEGGWGKGVEMAVKKRAKMQNLKIVENCNTKQNLGSRGPCVWLVSMFVWEGLGGGLNLCTEAQWEGVCGEGAGSNFEVLAEKDEI